NDADLLRAGAVVDRIPPAGRVVGFLILVFKIIDQKMMGRLTTTGAAYRLNTAGAKIWVFIAVFMKRNHPHRITPCEECQHQAPSDKWLLHRRHDSPPEKLNHGRPSEAISVVSSRILIAGKSKLGSTENQREKGSKRALARARIAADKTQTRRDRKSTRLNSSHVKISYAVFCL